METFDKLTAWMIPKLMKDLDVTRAQAAGIVGSLAAETGGFKHMQELTPEGGRGGWGWAQWTGPRRRAFERRYGKGNDSREANYGMLVHELQNDPYWRRELRRVKRARTAKEASRVFSGSAEEGFGYLRPGVEHYVESADWAQQAMAIPVKKGLKKGIAQPVEEKEMKGYYMPNLMEEPPEQWPHDKILMELQTENKLLLDQLLKRERNDEFLGAVDVEIKQAARKAELTERERCAQLVENSKTISDEQWFKDALAAIAAIIRNRKIGE